ncbi:flagellar hook-length control protein FliK [Thermodesulforhabdus norvegica]|uniref:flagellar hook-length control protein FliK n=1 Tax=Thermodesulforhabdus norvegica TaxID=39841 RepID=UPI0015A68BA0|nr:flagellar hook-length control protein FliK [Thermodesulforhabdus norvegica]
MVISGSKRKNGTGDESLFLDEVRSYRERREKVDSGELPRAEEKSDDGKSEKDEEDLVEKVVNDLGLAYYFVPIEEKSLNSPEETLLSDDDSGSGSVEDLLDKFFLDAKNVEQLLAKFGIPSDVIETLHSMTNESNQVSLQSFLSLIKSVTDLEKNGLKLTALPGTTINELLNPIGYNNDRGFVISFDGNKTFSFSELGEILSNVAEKASESRENNLITLDAKYLKASSGGKDQLVAQYLNQNSDIVTSTNSTRQNFLMGSDIYSSDDLTSSASESGPLNLRNVRDINSVRENLNLSIARHSSVSRVDGTLGSNLNNNGGFNGNMGHNDQAMLGFTGYEGTLSLSGGMTNPETPVSSFTTFSTHSWVSQMSSYLQRMVVEGRNQLVLQLEPPELGQILIRLRAEGNRITTHISASNDSVRDMMQQSQYLLERYLQEQGLVLDGFSVDVHSGDDKEGTAEKADREIFSGSRGNGSMTVDKGVKPNLLSGKKWHSGSVYLFA